ncbi:Piwi-domain-containing protein [Xylariaceae sp. FL1651]|nr:Piwi-domain-containing protein [Xylariaceae sp. FL1651]
MSTWRGPSSRGGRGGPRGGGGGPRGGGGGPRGGGGGPRGGGGGSYRGGSSQVFSPPRGVPVPDPKVIETENSLLSSKTAGLSGLSPAEDFPRRPSYGVKGTGLVLWANYFTLTPSSKLVLNQYSLSVSPAATGKKLSRIIQLALHSPELQGSRQDIVTDFKSTLITTLKIQEHTITVQYRAEGEDEPRDDALRYTVKMSYTKSLPVADLINYLASMNLSTQNEEKLSIIQAFNIVVNYHAKSNSGITTIGASKSFSLTNADKWDLEAGLTAMRGFFTSVRAATARVLLNVNVSHAAFYQVGPLDGLISSFLRRNSRPKLKAFLRRLRVKTNHLKERKNKSGQVIERAKTICGLATQNDGSRLGHPPRIRGFAPGPKDVEFWLDEHPSKDESSSVPKGKKKGNKGAPPKGKPASSGGHYISVYDFFRNTHKIQISDPSLPVVNVGTPENPSYLPPQVCFVLPGQPSQQKLSPDQAQRVINFAVRGPADNAMSIFSKGLQTAGLSANTSNQLDKFGITISPDLITVQGRLLVEPRVVYGQNQQAQVMGGSWNMVPRNSQSLRFCAGTALQKWSCLYVDMPDLYPAAESFTSERLRELMKEFRQVLQSVGINTAEPLKPQKVVLRETEDPALEDSIALAASTLQLLFVILPAGPIPVYNRLKQLADVKYGIHTVCSVGSKFAKGQDQYLRNEALKVNLKLGGDNHTVQPQNLGLITEDKTMVVGIDVTHPSPGSSSIAPSVAGMVASINPRLGQWPGILSIQSASRQEMVSDLKDMFKSRLALWRQKGKHAAFPENILVYRDGVSEGQYSTVLKDELPQLRAACKEVYPASDQAKNLPRITIVIVGKRHHTRFYVTKESDADRSGNSKAGTVVDRGVTEARNWDFFLQSHAAIKGTARPAHYFVLLDEIFRPRFAKVGGKNIADELQMITQSMCYTFGRATKAVSYCTPAYYADVLCERARRYLYHVFDTPDNSAIPSITSGGSHGAAPSPDAVRVHPRLRDSMFFV